MKVSDYIVSYFESIGINVIFGYQGGMITHLTDSISKSSKIRFIQTYHEQSAAIAAEGYARETGKIGVAISTSGPGATNMVTGIANAFFDSIPVVYITGQVNTYEYKYSKNIRQQGFQETDIVSIVKPITKYAVMINDPKELQYELTKAVSIAKTGRMGPVLIDLPMNIQRSEIDVSDWLSFCETDLKLPSFEKTFTDVIELLKNAKKPLVLCGGGIASAKCSDLVNEFLKKTGIPFCVSLMGKGCVDETLCNCIGMIGSYGNRNANISLSKADVVLVLGSRLDLRQTGNNKSEIFSKMTFIHVDIDNQELENGTSFKKINIWCDLKLFMQQILNVLPSFNCIEWLEYNNKIKIKYNQKKEVERFVESKFPYQCIDMIQEQADETSIYTVDIGQNQMWAAQTLQLNEKQRFYTSGGLAPMGYALHSAIGAAFASPEKHIFCIIGDGGFHISLQSLMLISQYNLKITVCILNNSALGMITQFQDLYFNSNMVGTTQDSGYLVPEISSVSKAYNLSYKLITPDSLIQEKEEISNYKIVEFRIPGRTKVSPKLEYNQPLYNMNPYLSDSEINDL